MGANKDSTTSTADRLEELNRKPLKEPIEGEVMPSDVGGAPTKYTPQVVSKLIAAFNNAYNVSEACWYAGISRDTYYEWLDSKPGFSDRMEDAKSKVLRRAKEVVIAAVDAGDANLAFKLLQAKDPEFKSKVEVSPGKGLEETREKIKEFLDEPTNYDDSTGEPTATESDVAGAEPSATTAADASDEVAQPTPDIS